MRSLTNPDIRLLLRADLPAIVSLDRHALLPVVRAELEKQGETIHAMNEINLVCPQKDPDLFPGHFNMGLNFQRVAARKFRRELSGAGISAHQLRLTAQNAVCETVHLNRARRTGLIHCLTARQSFNVNAQRYAQQPTRFLSADAGQSKHYFVIFDWYVVSGTTLANLASYITHNGGHVLAVATLFGYNTPQLLSPKGDALYLSDTVGAKIPFDRIVLPEAFASGNTDFKTMATIGYLLALSAFKSGEEDITIKTVLERTEEVLNKMGHSLLALTHGEAQGLVRGLEADVMHRTQSTYTALAQRAV